jgi:hypothetical protein
MRHAIFRTAIMFALALALPFGAAQAQPKQAPQKGPPPPAPVKPYTPIAIKLPPLFNDASFEAFRKQLGEIASKKDRAGLAKMVVAQGFFWDGEKGNQADPKKSGVDNFAQAIGLIGNKPVGWDMLQGMALDPTAASYPGKQGVICAPADPQFDDKQLEELAKSTGTDPGDWAYPLDTDTEVLTAPKQDAPVLEKLGLHLVRVMIDEKAPQTPPGQVPLIKVAMPSGKVGFVPADALSPLGNDQVCYLKDGAGWKITGFIGAGPGPQ